MRILADETKVSQLIDRLAEAVGRDVAGFKASGQWALVGLRSRGDVLARRLAAKLHPDHVGTLDFTLYRDDLQDAGSQALVQATEIDFAVDGMNVVLVDDVLMTGRSVRAALQSLMDLGRPQRVWLAVLVDRGGRELPIAADHVALDLTGPTLSPRETVEVRLRPTDECDQISVCSADEPVIE